MTISLAFYCLKLRELIINLLKIVIIYQIPFTQFSAYWSKPSICFALFFCHRVMDDVKYLMRVILLTLIFEEVTSVKTALGKFWRLIVWRQWFGLSGDICIILLSHGQSQYECHGLFLWYFPNQQNISKRICHNTIQHMMELFTSTVVELFWFNREYTSLHCYTIC